MTHEEAILSVWRQSLLEGLKTVRLRNEQFPVRSTAKQKLKQVDFRFDRPRSARLGTESEYEVAVGSNNFKAPWVWRSDI